MNRAAKQCRVLEDHANLRTQAVLGYFWIFWPSINIRPFAGSYKRISKLVMVVLPSAALAHQRYFAIGFNNKAQVL